MSLYQRKLLASLEAEEGSSVDYGNFRYRARLLIEIYGGSPYSEFGSRPHVSYGTIQHGYLVRIDLDSNVNHMQALRHSEPPHIGRDLKAARDRSLCMGSIRLRAFLR